MFISYRNLLAVTAAAVALVAVALAIRITRERPEVLELPWSSGFLQRLVPDGSFYSPVQTPKAAVKPAARPSNRNPNVSAESYLIGDAGTGEIMAEQNGSEVLPVASMSKLVTALAATDVLLPTTTIEITTDELSGANETDSLKAGERFTVGELLYPLLLDSSNVAAEALASTTARAGFLELMSSYAWEIGMPSTFFADPSGISPQNQSTARDFFALAQYLYKSRPDILAITRTASSSVATTTDHGAHGFSSIHPFVNDPAFLGGKTGHTPQAHDTMLTILNIGGRPIAIVVLASDDRRADTAVLAGQARKMLAQR